MIQFWRVYNLYNKELLSDSVIFVSEFIKFWNDLLK